MNAHRGSHYTTIPWLITMWTPILKVLQNVYDDDISNDYRDIVASLISKIENYQFTFVMYLTRHLLGITNELSLALKDQNIVQAMHLIEAMRVRLQQFRETNKRNFWRRLALFCEENSTSVPTIKDNMRIRSHSRREGQFIIYFHIIVSKFSAR